MTAVERVMAELEVDAERATEILRVGRYQRRGSSVPRMLYDGDPLELIAWKIAIELDLRTETGVPNTYEIKRIFDHVSGLPWTGCVMMVPTGGDGDEWLAARDRLIGIAPDPRLDALIGC